MTSKSKEWLKETRKIQVTGGSTLTLSLPSKWVKRHQLTKGNALLLTEEADGSLSVKLSESIKAQEKDEAFIRVSSNESPSAVTRKVISSYLVGYSILHVMAQSQQQLSSNLRNELRNNARAYLVGTEVLVDTPTDLALKVLLDHNELSVESALRRMSIIASSMFKDAIAALGKMDKVVARTVLETDSEVDRFNLYVVRQLKVAVANPIFMNEIGLEKPIECLGYRLLTKTIERTADRATSIAENVLLMKESPRKELLSRIDEMSGLVISMFEDAMSSLFKRDFNLAESVIEKKDQIMKLATEATHASYQIDTEETAHFHSSLRLIIENIRRTAEYAKDIAEIVLNLNVESVLGQLSRPRANNLQQDPLTQNKKQNQLE